MVPRSDDVAVTPYLAGRSEIEPSKSAHQLTVVARRICELPKRGLGVGIAILRSLRHART